MRLELQVQAQVRVLLSVPGLELKLEQELVQVPALELEELVLPFSRVLSAHSVLPL